MVELILDYGSCSRLHDRADVLFESRIELHMDGLQLVFEAPGARAIKGCRILSFSPSRRNMLLEIRPT